MTAIAPVTDTYLPHRAVPVGWQEALERIVPRSPTVPWLLLRWMPGIFYEPVSRWVIYECQPNLALVPPEWLADLRQDSPRERGRWIVDPTVPEHLGGKRWVSDALHSTVQWEIFGETGCYPVMFWIIQGERGGHVYRLNQVTQNFRLSLGGADVPNPGDLPYAEWDERVAAQIARYDRLRRWHAHMQRPWTDRTLTKTVAGLWVDGELYDLEKQYAREMLTFLDAQIEDVVRDIPRRLLPHWADLPPGDPHFNRDAEALERSLVEDTTHQPRPVAGD